MLPVMFIFLIYWISRWDKMESFCPEYETDYMGSFYEEPQKVEEEWKGLGIKGWSIIGFIYIIFVVVLNCT
jgi:hypothetical protein